MPTERIAMRKVREILRLTYDAGLPSREVARRVGVGSTGVRMMLQRFRASKLEWPLPDGLTDTALELELYGVAAKRGSERGRHEPDWAVVNRELKRKHVTLQVLWDEYIEAHPDGYRYSRFCELYCSWEGRLPVTMRQTHLGGDRMFVDYARLQYSARRRREAQADRRARGEQPGPRPRPARADGDSGNGSARRRADRGRRRPRLLQDRGYRGLRGGRVTAYVPKPIRGPAVREGFFGKDVFRYEPDRDVFVCPAGAELSLRYRGKSQQCEGRLCQPRCLQGMRAEIALYSVIPPRLASGERGRSRPHGGAVGG